MAMDALPTVSKGDQMWVLLCAGISMPLNYAEERFDYVVAPSGKSEVARVLGHGMQCDRYDRSLLACWGAVPIETNIGGIRFDLIDVGEHKNLSAKEIRRIAWALDFDTMKSSKSGFVYSEYDMCFAVDQILEIIGAFEVAAEDEFSDSVIPSRTVQAGTLVDPKDIQLSF